MLDEGHPFPITRITALQEWEKSGEYEKILGGEYPKRGAESERDAQRDFERARSFYSGEFADSEDPLAKAAGKVMDAFGGLFGQAGNKEGGDSRKGAGGPRSIEDVIDEIFGSRR